MWKAMFVGALALTTVGTSFASADSTVKPVTFRPASHSGAPLTSARIAHLKSMFKLTPEQERYWAPVEAALRGIIRQSRHISSGSDAAAEGTGHGGSGAAIDPTQLHQLGSAAMPLIMSLDDGQKREVRKVARAMGLAHVASMF